MTDPWLVVGLGNPTDRYARNRHNVGHMVVDLLAARAGARWTSHRSRTLVAEVRVGVLPGGVPGPRVVLAKSTGYMNVTGGPVAALARSLGIEAARILVIHDDLDLPLGISGSRWAGERAGTTGCGTSARPSAPATTPGSGSASGVPPGGWTPPTTCSATSPLPSARTCPSFSRKRARRSS